MADFRGKVSKQYIINRKQAYEILVKRLITLLQGTDLLTSNKSVTIPYRPRY